MIEFTYENQYNNFQKIQNIINNDDKYFIGRLSGNETRLTGLILQNKFNLINEQLIFSMIHGAGIYFENEEDIKLYCNIYLEAVKNTTLLGVWDGIMKSQAIDFYNFLEIHNLDKNYIPAQSIEFFYYLNEEQYNINKILNNKKILIISSHKNTINKQLQQLDKIYPNKKIFENCKFFVYKPPQQNGGNCDGKTWNNHFSIMKYELQRITNFFDFDIAFVSCGGFGMPICNYIYTELNKSVIYVGGSLQLFFGIMGKRWKTNNKVMTLVNDFWCYPEDSDKPKNIKLVENGCYW
jgi:hypothetical protein